MMIQSLKMKLLHALVAEMLDEPLQAAFQDMLAWMSSGVEPSTGPLADLAALAADPSLSTRKRLEMASTAVLTRVPATAEAALSANGASGTDFIALRGTVSRLIDSNGALADEAFGVDAEVTFSHRAKRAQVFDAAGDLIGELVDSRFESVCAGGIVLVGMEELTPGAGLRQQLWRYAPTRSLEATDLAAA